MDLVFVHTIQRRQTCGLVGSEKGRGERVLPAGIVGDTSYVRGAAGGDLDLGYKGFEGEVSVDDARGSGGEELAFAGFGGAGDGDDGFYAEDLSGEAGEEAGDVGACAEEDDGLGGMGEGFISFPWG